MKLNCKISCVTAEFLSNKTAWYKFSCNGATYLAFYFYECFNSSENLTDFCTQLILIEMLITFDDDVDVSLLGIIVVLRTRTARARIKTRIRRARIRIGIDTVVPWILARATKTRTEVSRRTRTARSTRRKRIRTDIPLPTPRAIRRSIVRRRKIRTSTEKVHPAVKTSTAMKKTKIAIAMIRIDVSGNVSNYVNINFVLFLIARRSNCS